MTARPPAQTPGEAAGEVAGGAEDEVPGEVPGEVRLPGGNVGGAWKVGQTVRRTTGPWTPAVHALLAHLEGLRCVPRVHGFDEQGREVLDFLPGRIVDVETELLTDAQLVSVARWTRELHEAVAGFTHPGPWRFFGADSPILVGHNDIAPYNICFDGDELAGVFDWDLAGPTTPRLELGWLAWQAAPLVRRLPDEWTVRRLGVLARAYGGEAVDAEALLDATVDRVELAIRGVLAAVAAGDPGMIALHRTTGEPEPMRRALARLRERLPQLRRLARA